MSSTDGIVAFNFFTDITRRIATIENERVDTSERRVQSRKIRKEDISRCVQEFIKPPEGTHERVEDPNM